jgi:hypothetical protein
VFFVIWLLVCAYNGLMLSDAKKSGGYWVHGGLIVIMLVIAAIVGPPEALMAFVGVAALAWLVGRLLPGKK